jgi:hypothetical protein
VDFRSSPKTAVLRPPNERARPTTLNQTLKIGAVSEQVTVQGREKKPGQIRQSR